MSINACIKAIADFVSALFGAAGGGEKVAAQPELMARPVVETVTVIGGGAYELDALWTFPGGPGPFAAVILVHGSGPQDKDESIGPNKPFKDLADGLAARGLAVLRYEKRTRQFAKYLDVNKLTVQEETIDDALAAIQTARACRLVDPGKVLYLATVLAALWCRASLFRHRQMSLLPVV